MKYEIDNCGASGVIEYGWVNIVVDGNDIIIEHEQHSNGSMKFILFDTEYKELLEKMV